MGPTIFFNLVSFIRSFGPLISLLEFYSWCISLVCFLPGAGWDHLPSFPTLWVFLCRLVWESFTYLLCQNLISPLTCSFSSYRNHQLHPLVRGTDLVYLGLVSFGSYGKTTVTLYFGPLNLICMLLWILFLPTLDQWDLALKHSEARSHIFLPKIFVFPIHFAGFHTNQIVHFGSPRIVLHQGLILHNIQLDGSWIHNNFQAAVACAKEVPSSRTLPYFVIAIPSFASSPLMLRHWRSSSISSLGSAS